MDCLIVFRGAENRTQTKRPPAAHSTTKLHPAYGTKPSGFFPTIFPLLFRKIGTRKATILRYHNLLMQIILN